MPLLCIRFLKTIKAEEFQVWNGKMSILRVGDLLGTSVTIFSLDFTLGVYNLHTQCFTDLTFLPHDLSYLKRFQKVLLDKVKETTLSEKKHKPNIHKNF